LSAITFHIGIFLVTDQRSSNFFRNFYAPLVVLPLQNIIIHYSSASRDSASRPRAVFWVRNWKSDNVSFAVFSNRTPY